VALQQQEFTSASCSRDSLGQVFTLG